MIFEPSLLLSISLAEGRKRLRNKDHWLA